MHRSVFAILLALVLSLTSVSMALARGGMSVFGTMELCLDAAQVSVPIGPDGQPQTHSHICPDCTITLMIAPVAPIISLIATRAIRLDLLVPLRTMTSILLLGGHGRGPPTLV
jgi:hypothetical protein